MVEYEVGWRLRDGTGPGRGGPRKAELRVRFLPVGPVDETVGSQTQKSGFERGGPVGRSHDEFVKYPRTPHLFGSRGTDDDKHLGEAESARFLTDTSLIVEEKLDGTNVGIDFRCELDIEATDDQGEVIRVARGRCRELLRPGRSFAFNAINLRRLTQQRWIDLFADYGARIEMVYVEPSLSVLFDQNKRRGHPVPEKVIRELAARREPPTLTEDHGLVLHQLPGHPEA